MRMLDFSGRVGRSGARRTPSSHSTAAAVACGDGRRREAAEKRLARPGWRDSLQGQRGASRGTISGTATTP